VELSQVRAFVAVSRAGTIASAAQELHVTTSPLSRTIRDLERRLGEDLFTRDYHQFRRTQFGEAFLPLAVEILAQAEEAESLAAFAGTTLRIGATPWTYGSLISEFRDRATAASPRVSERSDLSSTLLESLRHGDLDMALVHLPTGFPGIAGIPLARYRYGVMASDRTELPGDGPLLLSHLKGQRLLSLPLVMQPKPMATMLERIRSAGVESIEEIDLRDLIGLRARIDRTGELMLVSKSDDLPSARFFDLEHSIVRELADGELDFEVGLAWRERDTVHRAGIEAIVEAMAPPDGAVPYL
jgi:DNA-binding transcriptional LysR family regulator